MRISAFPVWAVLDLLAVGSPQVRGDMVIFKDGFVLYGKIKQQGGMAADLATGQGVWMPSGFFVLDSDARRVFLARPRFRMRTPRTRPGKPRRLESSNGPTASCRWE